MAVQPDLTPLGDPIIDRFVDDLWLEDGLAKLTLAAYRRDLALFNGWLALRGGLGLLQVAEALSTERAVPVGVLLPSTAKSEML